MTTPKEIGKIFTEAREKRKLSIPSAANQSHIHQNVVKDIESGVFDRLGKLYVKSFMKKYALFLDLDADSIIEKYASLSSKIPGREFDLNEEKDRKDETIIALTDKRVQMVFAGVLSVIILVLLVVLIGMMRSRMSPPARPAKRTLAKKVEVPAPAKEKSSKPEEKSIFSRVRPRAKKSASVVLTLEARDEVWVEVKKGNEKLFSGILKDGDSKTWSSDGDLNVRTGRAGKLEFTVNDRKIGVVASGVVKDIRVSSGGVKVGDVWVARLD